ncbi:MAG: DUF805 domain-containing protein [Rhodobacteraceae bacterium]|nr:DUF805 domain-containing protein [Paracoccaceae bacterium]
MTFSQAVKTCFSKFLTFSGRASRPEYWYFFLFITLWQIVAGVIDVQFFTQVIQTEVDGVTTTVVASNRPVQSIVGLIVFLPHLAVAWRRMHDTGRSGLYALFPILLMLGAGGVLVFGIGIADLFAGGGSMDLLFTRLTLGILIPTFVILLISPLLVLWWLTRPSQPGENRYGQHPLERNE